MQTFIESEVLDGLKKGSMESFSDYLAAAASKELGEEVTLFATHRDHAFGIVGDRVVKVTWKRTEEGTTIRTKDAKVPVITDESLDSFIAKKLSETVTSIMDGDLDTSRTRLRTVVPHLSPKGRYWTSDGVSMVEQLIEKGSSWLEQYEENRPAVRKAVHGVLGETEKQVPKTPYSRIPRNRIGEFDSEIRESLGQIRKLLNGLPDLVRPLTFTEDEAEGIELDQARKEILSESTKLEGAVGLVLRFLRTEDLPVAAKVHDILAERLKPMLVVGRFLSRLSDSQQRGEKEDDASP